MCQKDLEIASATNKEVEEGISTEDKEPLPEQYESNAHPDAKAMRRKAWLQFFALCMAIFVAGWNDGTTGPLVPRLQEVYHVGCRNRPLHSCGLLAHLCQVGYAVVSLIFIANCIVRVCLAIFKLNT